MVQTYTFITLQKNAVFKLLEMDNNTIQKFLQKNILYTTIINLQKEAIQKIYEMDSQTLENFLYPEEKEDYE